MLTASGRYLLRRCFRRFVFRQAFASVCIFVWSVEGEGGTPYIPFKSNTVIPKDDSIWAKMYHLFMFNREEFMRHYHQRSNVESVFSMIKGKFGDAVRSKSDVGQVNEVLAKVLCHNMCVLIRATHDLGVEPTFGAGTGVEPKIFV